MHKAFANWQRLACHSAHHFLPRFGYVMYIRGQKPIYTAYSEKSAGQNTVQYRLAGSRCRESVHPEGMTCEEWQAHNAADDQALWKLQRKKACPTCKCHSSHHECFNQAAFANC